MKTSVRQVSSCLLSLLIHLMVAAVLLHAVRLPSLDLEKVMELDLTRMEEPEIVVPMPAPPPSVAVPEPLPPDAVVAPAPLSTDKTIVLDDSPPEQVPPEAVPAEVAEAESPEPEVAVEPASGPEPEVVEISPVKTSETTDEAKPDKIYVRKDDVLVHRGHEARFGRAMMADYYSYSPSEFSGHFRTRDDRIISIIDARETQYGRFLIYDSKNKTLRRLKQALGKYVYTIGPSVYADEPVTGTVTFLAKNDRIERFILTTDDDRMAHYPSKIHIREQTVAVPLADGGKLDGELTLPPEGEGHAGVVFVHGDECVDVGMIKGVTRSLGMNGLASLSFTPRSCKEEGGAAGTLNGDVAEGLRFLAENPAVNRAGLWGNGLGVPVVLRVALNGEAVPKFMVCVVDDSVQAADLPDREDLRGLEMPVMWLVTGRNTAQRKGFIRLLESMRDKASKPFTIVVAPLKASRDVEDARGELSGWVENVVENNAQLVISWIDSVR